MGLKTRMLLAVAAALAAAQLATAPAWAFGMCGRFRLKDLLKQAETILVLEFSDANADGLARAKVVKVFKGDANLPAGRTLSADFLAMGEQLSVQGKEVMARIAKGNRQAVLFSGTLDTKAGPEETADTEEAHVKGFLCIAGKWVSLERSSDGVWDMALVLANGDVCVFPRKVTNDRPAAGLRLGLTPGAEHVGPVSVTVSLRTGPSEGRTSGSGMRNLGCWTVPAGGEPVLIGTRPGSIVQLQWHWPGGEPVTRRVKVRDAVVSVALDSAKP